MGTGGGELEQRAGRGARKACFGVTVRHGFDRRTCIAGEVRVGLVGHGHAEGKAVSQLQIISPARLG
jgi:hypothetical protein